MSPINWQPATIRELEHRMYLIFGCGVGGFGAGVGLTFSGIYFLGPPLLVFSALTLLVGMGWMCILGARPTREIPCPHCARANQVYVCRSCFTCESCGKLVRFRG
jgi:hypothetical protein